jgi:hypothetical protein
MASYEPYKEVKMTRIVKYVRRHKIALLGTALATTVIVFQHKCIVEALDIINENGLGDQI